MDRLLYSKNIDLNQAMMAQGLEFLATHFDEGTIGETGEGSSEKSDKTKGGPANCEVAQRLAWILQ